MHSSKLEGALRGLRALQAKASDVLDWLYLLKFINPRYRDVDISPISQDDINNFRDQIIANRMNSELDQSTEAFIEVQTSDITHPPVDATIASNLTDKNTLNSSGLVYILQLYQFISNNTFLHISQLN